MKINPGRLGLEERYLPPGTMRDMWEQMLSSEGIKVSFPQFWRIWKSEYPHLKFRASSSHALCAVCLRHKLLIRELGHHLKARSAQRDLFNAHLQHQYSDRCQYWRARAASRLRGADIVLIIDSMDQAKFMYPRGDVYRSKELGTLQRPRAHITGVLCHGHLTLFSVSEHDMPKDSTTMVELVAHTLTLLRDSGVNLRESCVTIQSDNTSREMKNNPFLKFLSFLVANGVVQKAMLSALRTGHSHEDIDQVFGQIAKHLSTKARSAATPYDFKDHITQWMQTSMKRPHEAGKHCVVLDQTRNWYRGRCILRFTLISYE